MYYQNRSEASPRLLTTGNETSSNDYTGLELPLIVIFGFIALLLIIATLVGNVLVISAVFVVRKLHQPSNYLLISLAVADFFVALFVMPLAALYQFQSRWNFGGTICLIWTTFDVLLCTASILNLCVVSVDRYWAISRALTYGSKRTTGRILFYVLIVWILATAISVLPIFAFDKPRTPGDCSVNQSLGYQLYATISAFYIPVLIIIVVNCKIFHEAAKLQKRDSRNGEDLLRLHSPQRRITSLAQRETNFEIHIGHRKRFSISRWLQALKCPVRFHVSRSRTGRLKESKAARTLSIIMGAFITCWLPFFIIAVVKPICGLRCHVPKWLDELTLWLGYSNSALNPILYAAFNRDFRVPFREILCCRCKSIRRAVRVELFTEIYGDSLLSAGSRLSQPLDHSRMSASIRTPITRRSVL